jgi:hypothetical protein
MFRHPEARQEHEVFTATLLLVNGFITSRLDYCNGTLVGLPSNSADRLQAVGPLNAQHACCVGPESSTTSHPCSETVFTGSVCQSGSNTNSVYWSLNASTISPSLSDDITPLSTIPSWQRLSSSSTADLLVPATNIGVRDYVFGVAGPVCTMLGCHGDCIAGQSVEQSFWLWQTTDVTDCV